MYVYTEYIRYVWLECYFYSKNFQQKTKKNLVGDGRVVTGEDGTAL